MPRHRAANLMLIDFIAGLCNTTKMAEAVPKLFKMVLFNFFKLFISNQNYFRFYKLICCDSIYMTWRGLSNDKSSLTFLLGRLALSHETTGFPFCRLLRLTKFLLLWDVLWLSGILMNATFSCVFILQNSVLENDLSFPLISNTLISMKYFIIDYNTYW
jgi:hypothetical protein